MARGRKPCTYFRNWLFAVEGSPTMHTLMSPRSLMPSAVCLCTPPRSIRSTPRFTWRNRTAGHPYSRRESVGSVDSDSVDSGDSGSVLRSVRRFRFQRLGCSVGSAVQPQRYLAVRLGGSVDSVARFILSLRSVPRFWFDGSAVRLVRRFGRFSGSAVQYGSLAIRQSAGRVSRLRWFRLSLAGRRKR